MNNFLRSGVMSEEGKLARVLKCIQQEIICPAVMSLRTDVYPKFPYKDLKGTWYVRVELFFETSESAQSTRMRSMPSISDSAGSGMVKRGRKRTRDQNKETGEPRVGRKERMRSIPEDWMQRTYSMPAFDPLPSRRKRSKSANKESTGPGRKSSLRESLRQTISMDDSDVEEEAVNPLSRMGSIIIPTQRGGKEELRRSVKELSHGTLKRVRVLHRKRERSSVLNVIPDPNAEPDYCEFEWELALTFDGNMDTLQEANLQVIDITTCAATPQERGEDLIQAIRKYTTREFPYIISWKSLVLRQSLHKEFSALVTFLSVKNAEGRVLFEPSSSKLGISSLLLCLSLHCDTSDALSESILAFSEKSHGMSKNIKSFIASLREELPSEAKLLRLLQALAPEMMTPTLAHLRATLKGYAKEVKPIKDSKQIELAFAGHEIVIAQSQRIRCVLDFSVPGAVSGHGDCVMEFAIVDQLLFSSAMDHLNSVTTEITEHAFLSPVSKAEKDLMREILKPYFTKNTLESRTSTIPVATALRCLENTFARLKEEDQVIRDPSLPGGSITCANLLQLLAQSVPKNFPPITYTAQNSGSPDPSTP